MKNIIIALLTRNQDSFAPLFHEAFEKEGVDATFIYPHTGIAKKAVAMMRPRETTLLIVDTASLGDMSDFLQEIRKEIPCRIWTHSGWPVNKNEGITHITNDVMLEKEVKKFVASL